MKRPRLKRPRLSFEHYESKYLFLIVLYALADTLIFALFSIPTRDTVISQITGVFVTVEGVLIGLIPKVNLKKLRDIEVLFGFVALLVTVGTFAKSTYETIQSGWLSWFPTTLLFILSGSLFLGFVELYAFALLYPFTPKDPDKEARKKVAEAW